MFEESNLVKLDQCLACGSHDLVLTLDLNSQPLANSYKNSAEDQQENFPLAINRCKNCYHVQLTHAVNPSLMYKNYLYVSGTTKTYLDYMNWYAGWTAGCYSLLNDASAKSVLDIGCNDGSQLNFYKQRGLETVGVDPAENLYERSSANHRVYLDFFNTALAKQIDSQFDIISMQNAFAHQYNPLEFLEAIALLMHNNSLLFLQTSQANMIVKNEFDTIYHEHVNFYNINSMHKLAERAGLYLINVYKTPIHGTSYIFVLSKNPKHYDQKILNSLINGEAQLGLLEDSTYVKYQNRCEELAKDLVEKVSAYTLEHDCKAVGYGAAAKGMTLLNYTGLKLDFIIDDNPLKQGTFTPGSSIPIVGSAELDNHKDSVIFVPLAWNFYNEIVAKIKKQRNNPNDRFCTYFPTVEIMK